jgi:cytochrome bd-type quinol oxidase subunit 2
VDSFFHGLSVLWPNPEPEAFTIMMKGMAGRWLFNYLFCLSLQNYTNFLKSKLFIANLFTSRPTGQRGDFLYLYAQTKISQNMNEIIKKNGITFGIIMGVVSALITTLVYAIDMELFTSFKLMGFILLVSIVLYCVLLSKTRKQLGGDFSFKQAFTTFFIAAVISTLISTTFNILLFNVIDPGAKETLKELSIKAAEEMMEKFGAPQEQMEEALAQVENTDNFSVGNLIKGFFTSLIFSAILGLILALIFKSKPAYRE